ncbi:MAG: hypothetical protein WCC53_15080 [Thermoanaerobaculia bacterium]|jgi:hypothetical protein
MELPRILDEVLQDESLSCGAVIDEFGEVLARAGNFETFPEPSLVSSALGPSGTPRATYASLDGQPLPQIWAEGQCFAFIDRPTPGVAFVLFGVLTRPRLAFLRPRSGEHESDALVGHSKRVSRRLREIISR